MKMKPHLFHILRHLYWVISSPCSSLTGIGVSTIPTLYSNCLTMRDVNPLLCISLMTASVSELYEFTANEKIPFLNWLNTRWLLSRCFHWIYNLGFNSYLEVFVELKKSAAHMFKLPRLTFSRMFDTVSKETWDCSGMSTQEGLWERDAFM